MKLTNNYDIILIVKMKSTNIKYLLFGLILIISLLGSCVYIGSPAPPTEPAPPPAVETPAPSPPNPEWNLPPAVSQAAMPDFISVVAKVKPSVVAINTEVTTFDVFSGRSIQKGSGSGWILDKEGRIVTNNHVVEGARNITVTFANDTTLPASVVGTDPLNDIAVLKVSGTDFAPVQIGDSSRLKLGEWVLAVGNALGRGIGVTQGIVSRLGATITVESGQTLYDLIQTSAAINPGNSGGPLVNMAGEVVGITSAKLAAVGVEAQGYAISSNTARPIIEELAQKGYTVRPWLGVVLQSVSQWLVLRYNLSVDKGVFVTEVARGSPADKAGLKAGDIIVNVNGKDVASADDLVRAIRSSRIGDTMTITYWRGKQKNTTSAALGESPKPGQ